MELRELLRSEIERLVDLNTHQTLGGECVLLGLPEPPGDGTKRERVRASYAAAADDELPQIAAQVLARNNPTPATRNAIQDFLWSMQDHPEIVKRTRREIARNIDIADLIRAPERFQQVLAGLWIIDEPLGFLFGPTLQDEIDRHVIRNDDWSAEELFDRLGAFEASDRRFGWFLENLTSADILMDEPLQRRFVEAVNRSLRGVGLELREIDTVGGYPVFGIVSTQAATSRRPKNLVFGSPTKPDIRIRDAVNNDIEVVDNPEGVLVYDRRIGAEGIRWRDLQVWWKETRSIDDPEDAKSSLYKRLRSSIPSSSPPQILLFDLYHEIYADAVPDLPALLPEVWLHWDPKTVRERGADALLRFRMDFLMLLPNGLRVVLEVDGLHHYSVGSRPSPTEYAKNMRADRDLKLSGYEVFRFGAAELCSRTAKERGDSRRAIGEFFAAMFRRYDVAAADDATTKGKGVVD